MKQPFNLLLLFTMFLNVTASAAISINLVPPIWQTFTNAPAVGDWSTLAIDGSASSIGTVEHDSVSA